MFKLKIKKNENGNVAFGLAGTFSEHEQYYSKAYNEYLKHYPNSIIFPIFIGKLPSEYEENNGDLFKFKSYDINPSHLQYMFSNFTIPVVFIKVNSKPGKSLFRDDLILTSVNIVYGRKYFFCEHRKTLSWINNITKIDLAIIDSTKEFGVTELPANMLKTVSVDKVLKTPIKDQDVEKFELRRIVDKFNEDGYYFELN